MGAGVALSSADAGAQDGASLAASRAQHLSRGINTSLWFAQSPGRYTVERLRNFTTTDDIVLIHQLGFDHIRLSIDPEPLVGWQRNSAEGAQFMAELDRVVGAALEQKLAVVIDLHPESRYKQQLLQGSGPVERFGSLWQSVAKHFAGLDPNMVFFEIMNEPEQPDPYRWQGIESFVAGQIRAVAPQHTIIAGGAKWSGLDDLMLLEPIGYDNVIYTFHDYEPFAFTHQGATWTDSAVQPLRGVPYPSTPENVAANMLQEPTLAGQLFVQQYGLARWDAQRVDATIGFAERWSKAHHAPVYCGEFGVHRPYADGAMRAQWLRDMRVAFERHHIGWAMWDYQDSFGVVTKKNGTTTPDAAIVDALGLKGAK
jgi:aryl-phospho-beta-D-glucosidase BglC (GH1 family)